MPSSVTQLCSENPVNISLIFLDHYLHYRNFREYNLALSC